MTLKLILNDQIPASFSEIDQNFPLLTGLFQKSVLLDFLSNLIGREPSRRSLLWPELPVVKEKLQNVKDLHCLQTGRHCSVTRYLVDKLQAIMHVLRVKLFQ